MIDAAAKMPHSRCLKGCSPLPKCCCFFSGDSPPPASSLSSPTPSPVRSISCSPSGCFKSTKKRWAGSAGSQGRQTWGTLSPWCHMCWGPLKASSQGRGLLAPKVRVPALGREKAKPWQSGSRGGWLCSEKGRGAGMRRAVWSGVLFGPGLIRTITLA